jgi:hypothetical protein
MARVAELGRVLVPVMFFFRDQDKNTLMLVEE